MEPVPVPKVKPKSRKNRKHCYGLNDPTHVCSTNHVRVPAHCRLKRHRKKAEQRAIKQVSALQPTTNTTSTTVEQNNVPVM